MYWVSQQERKIYILNKTRGIFFCWENTDILI